ncbi:MAG: hypothetical protein M3198_09865 [Actinomycetota bacterium]|nr:hypothetical protein [Actinomycetota bacterium]
MDALSAEIEGRVAEAIAAQQNLFENLWAFVDPDDTLGKKVWTFSLSNLVEDVSAPLNQRFVQGDDDWEVSGRIVATLPCAFETASKAMVATGEQPLEIQDFRRFRDQQMPKRRNLADWADLLQRNSTSVASTILSDKKARQIVPELLAVAKRLLADQSQPIPQDALRQIDQLLQAAIMHASPDAARDFRRLRRAATQLKGKRGADAIQLLSRFGPRSAEREA